MKKILKDCFSVAFGFALCAFMYYAYTKYNTSYLIGWALIAASGFAYDAFKIMKNEYAPIKGSDLMPIGVSATEMRIIALAKALLWSIITPVIYTGIGFVICEYFITCLIVFSAFGILYYGLEKSSWPKPKHQK